MSRKILHIYSLGAYIFDLKAMGVPIRATREPHDGGNHARYFLAGPVELVEVVEPAKSEITVVA